MHESSAAYFMARDFAGHTLVAVQGVSVTDFGKVVGIYFYELEPKKTQVRIVSEERFSPDKLGWMNHLFGEDWESELHIAIQARLK